MAVSSVGPKTVTDGTPSADGDVHGARIVGQKERQAAVISMNSRSVVAPAKLWPGTPAATCGAHELVRRPSRIRRRNRLCGARRAAASANRSGSQRLALPIGRARADSDHRQLILRGVSKSWLARAPRLRHRRGGSRRLRECIDQTCAPQQFQIVEALVPWNFAGLGIGIASVSRKDCGHRGHSRSAPDSGQIDSERRSRRNSGRGRPDRNVSVAGGVSACQRASRGYVRRWTRSPS